MKIGLISDIHTEIDNLKRALDLLKEHNIIGTLCAGDLVEKGPAWGGNAVVELVQEREIPTVRGNHDSVARSNQQWIRNNGEPGHPVVQERLLKNETLDFLDSLPMKRTFDIRGQRLVLAHGTPWSEWQYVYPNAMPSIFDRLADESNADVVVLGHTHRPMRIEVGDLVVVNPGSVASNYAMDSSTCAVLTLPERTVVVYDIRTGAEVDIPQRSV